MSRVEFNEIVNNTQMKSGYSVWWPVWAKEEALERREKVFAENRTVNLEVWEVEKREFTVEAGEPTTLRIATFYYPYWKAVVNGQNTEVQKDQNGTIVIPVSNEKSRVLLYFEEPYFNTIALWISLSTWVILLTLISLLYRKNKKTSAAIITIV